MEKIDIPYDCSDFQEIDDVLDRFSSFDKEELTDPGEDESNYDDNFSENLLISEL